MAANVPQTLGQVEALVTSRQFAAALEVFSPGAHVQIRVRGLVMCATAVRWSPAVEDMPGLFECRAQGRAYWVTRSNIRACSAVGDGRCVCDTGRGIGALSRADSRPVASPLGNTGVTA